MAKTVLSVRDLHRSYKSNNVLQGVSFDLVDGDFAVLYGLPAAGKSVLFRMIMGLEPVDAGTVMIRGENALAMLPGERNIGYVPQSFALFPNQTVHDNIAYPLTFTEATKEEIAEAVEQVAKMLQIQDHLQKLPSQTSGGQKQRIAIARGLVKKTTLFFLDDPLAGLDFKLREQLVDDLRTLQEKLGATFLYATSDPMEGLGLGKRILALNEGRIVDDQEPLGMYQSPRNIFSAERLSFPISNSMAGKIELQDERPLCVVPGLGTLVLPAGTRVSAGQAVTAVFKPEDIEIASTGAVDEPAIRFTASIQLREDLGGEQIIYLSYGDLELRSVQRHDSDEYLAGSTADFVIRAARVGVFDSKDGSYIASSEEFIDVRN